MHVFLSYSRRDAAFVGRLADDLAARGIDPWLDTDDLATEDDDRWRRSVVQGIRESVAIVLVLSPDSVQSGAVERELTIAAEMARRIIPIVQRPCELSDGLMFELAGLQRTDFVDQPYDDALDELVQRINAGTPSQVASAPSTVGSAQGRAADATARPRAGTEVRTTPTEDRADDRTRARRGTPRVVATVASLAAVVAALAGIDFVRDRDADDNQGRDASATVTEPRSVTTEIPEEAGSSRLVPWEEATATFERRDGTTATVRASTVALACATGSLEFLNGQTVSLELVDNIRFDANHPDSNSIDAVVTLLDGRQLPDPIHTWNCPIAGTTDLGPLSVPLDDIRHITFHRETYSPAGSSSPSLPDDAEPATLVPWEEADATVERRDGTTATVRASTVALACATGSLEFMNGQTVSLEKVEQIDFGANHLDSGSIDAVVTLLDGRQLPDPIHTRNCPIGGTTDLGPLSVPLEDIGRITFHR